MQTQPPSLASVRREGIVELSTGVSLQYKPSPPPQLSSSLEEPGGNVKLAVCLHPWSRMGGRMTDPVLRSLRGVFHCQGYHVLTYNSRGVGSSSGRASFTGVEEGKDLDAMVRWAVGEFKQAAVSTVLIVGYSYGSLIATLCPPLALDPPIKMAYILLSYPLGPRSFLTFFKGSFYDQKLKDIVGARKNKLLVAFGGRDDFTSLDNYTAWVAQLRQWQLPSAGVVGVGGEDERLLTVVSVPDASHFWIGEANEELQVEISRWLTTL